MHRISRRLAYQRAVRGRNVAHSESVSGVCTSLTNSSSCSVSSLTRRSLCVSSSMKRGVISVRSLESRLIGTMRPSQRLFCSNGDNPDNQDGNKDASKPSESSSQSEDSPPVPTEPMILAETRNQLARVSAEKSLAPSRKPWRSVVPYIGDVSVFAIQKPFFPGFSSTLQIIDADLKRLLINEFLEGKHWIGVFLHNPIGAALKTQAKEQSSSEKPSEESADDDEPAVKTVTVDPSTDRVLVKDLATGEVTEMSMDEMAEMLAKDKDNGTILEMEDGPPKSAEEWTDMVATNLDEINCDLIHRVTGRISRTEEVFGIGTLVKVDWDDPASNVKQFLVDSSPSTSESDTELELNDPALPSSSSDSATSASDTSSAKDSPKPGGVLTSDEPLYLKVIGARRIRLSSVRPHESVAAGVLGSIEHLEPTISPVKTSSESECDSDAESSNPDSEVVLRSEFNIASELLKQILRDDPDHREDLMNLWRNKHMIDIGFFADFAANLTNSTPRELQNVLECIDYETRLKELIKLLRREERMIGAREEIIRDVDAMVEKESTEKLLHMILHSTMRRLYQEYKSGSGGTGPGNGAGPQHTHRGRSSSSSSSGGGGRGTESEESSKMNTRYKRLAAKYLERMEGKKMNEEAKELFEEGIEKMQSMEQNMVNMDMENTKQLCDWLSALPWNVVSADDFDVKRAAQVLDEDHYGMTVVKERILEIIAMNIVRKATDLNSNGKKSGELSNGLSSDAMKEENIGTNADKVRGKILCLVGPPGVGKTSIGESIAKSLQRKFYKFSLGGNDDSHLLKGFLRTYVGANPGKLIYGLRTTGVSNPVMMIDEIDKMGARHSDPSHALLEILDHSQNHSFVDNYLDVPVDLSRVLFVCTANDESRINPILADRLHIVRLSGYDYSEKLEIARRYLIPKAFEICGVPRTAVQIDDSVIEELIRWYCRESGVRSLQQHLERIVSKAALDLVTQELITLPKQEPRRIYHGATSKNPNSEDDPNHQSENGNSVLAKVVTSVSSVLSSLSGSTTVTSDATPNSDAKADTSEDSRNATMIEESSSESGIESTETITMSDDCSSSSSSSSSEKSNSESTRNICIAVTTDNLKDFVGPRRFTQDRTFENLEDTPAGVVTGLAYSQMGGSTTYIETVKYKNHDKGGSLKCTGQLGTVMSESTEIAYVLARSLLCDMDSDNDFFNEYRIHLHAPEGGIPKDGPSAGITITSALLSLALNVPVSPDLAMTGEVSLTGKVLKIGGIREKMLAAKRANITTLIFPFDNKEDFYDDKTVPSYLRDEFEEVHFVTHYSQVFDLLFSKQLKLRQQPKAEESGSSAVSDSESSSMTL